MLVTVKPKGSLDVDIQAFEERYNREYQFLYDSDEHVAGYAEALAEAERFLSKHGASWASLPDTAVTILPATGSWLHLSLP